MSAAAVLSTSRGPPPPPSSSSFICPSPNLLCSLSAPQNRAGSSYPLFFFFQLLLPQGKIPYYLSLRLPRTHLPYHLYLIQLRLS